MSDRGIPDDVRYDGYREFYGRKVRQLWVDYCRETGDTKPSHLAPWEEISEWDREADRRIGTGIVEWNGDDDWVPVPAAEHDALIESIRALLARSIRLPDSAVRRLLPEINALSDALVDYRRAALATEAAP